MSKEFTKLVFQVNQTSYQISKISSQVVIGNVQFVENNTNNEWLAFYLDTIFGENSEKLDVGITKEVETWLKDSVVFPNITISQSGRKFKNKIQAYRTFEVEMEFASQDDLLMFYITWPSPNKIGLIEV